ncbi:MAG: L-glutamate gamma-semialdehyde dehydrogenase [Candidatus Bathyarchaeia archaeon]
MRENADCNRMVNYVPEGLFSVPEPINEVTLSYAPGSRERFELKEAISELRSKIIEIPLIIDGKPVKTDDLGECRCPHDHAHLLAKYHNAGEDEVTAAIESALATKEVWSSMEWADRASVFLKAAELLAGPYRQKLNAATMLCQSKNPFQAEIDAACELIDFWRFNVYFMQKLYKEQPDSSKGVWDRNQYRPLEGFIYAVTPFNFTSIGGNLPTAPAMMGNVVVWKPSSTAVYSNYFIMEILQEAGLPSGVINFIPGRASEVGKIPLLHPRLGGLHFTGSTETFKIMWRIIGENIGNYKSYPRIVGETGGKNFVVVHRSADLEEVTAAVIRGAFEYQGQKCSAASRLYVPESRWLDLKNCLLEETRDITLGAVENFANFVNAVIDKTAFDKIISYIEFAKKSKDAEIIIGGKYDDSKGYFVEPTVIVTKDPKFKMMQEEIFGPVLTVYVYPDDKYEETLMLCDQTSPYALTGSIFAKDRHAIDMAEQKLVNAAGNFYINDKPTGSVVAQQPFGGARMSGTNEKSGSMGNLLRWVSQRTIKENFLPPKNWRYPFMDEP